MTTRSLGRGALAGVVLFAAVCTAAQFLRTDLDWTQAPLSFYLVGPGGVEVKCAYFVLSAAIAAIGAGCYRALEHRARSAAPLLLFLLAAFALDVVALCDTATHRGDFSLHAFVHDFAALTTFLSITVAMLLQSWRFRADAAWRRRFPFAFGLATVTFAALLIDALVHTGLRGLQQKVVIALIVAWLGWTAHRLSRGGTIAGSRISGKTL